MPFRHIPPEQFGVDLLKLMQAAYDAACERLDIDGTSDPRSAKLANIIIELAAKGERELLIARALDLVKAASLGDAARYPSDNGLSAKFSGDKP